MIKFCYPNGKGLLKEYFALEIWTNRTRIGFVYFPSKDYRAKGRKCYISLKSKKYVNDDCLVNFLKEVTGVDDVYVIKYAGDI